MIKRTDIESVEGEYLNLLKRYENIIPLLLKKNQNKLANNLMKKYIELKPELEKNTIDTLDKFDYELTILEEGIRVKKFG